jgi:hypothetical protein
MEMEIPVLGIEIPVLGIQLPAMGVLGDLLFAELVLQTSGLLWTTPSRSGAERWTSSLVFGGLPVGAMLISELWKGPAAGART